MKLSLFSDYSLRTLIFAALKDDWFQIDELTRSYGISQHHLSKVVQNLAKSGHLQTRRGRGGGIRLVGAPSSINLGTLLRQTESNSPLLECFAPATNTCPLMGCCAAKAYFAQAIEAFFQSLDQRNLQDLVQNSKRPRMIQALNLGHAATPSAESISPRPPKTSPSAGKPSPGATKATRSKPAPAKASSKPLNTLPSKSKAKPRAGAANTVKN